jgi:hypothetical protein
MTRVRRDRLASAPLAVGIITPASVEGFAIVVAAIMCAIGLRCLQLRQDGGIENKKQRQEQ